MSLAGLVHLDHDIGLLLLLAPEATCLDHLDPHLAEAGVLTNASDLAAERFAAALLTL